MISAYEARVGSVGGSDNLTLYVLFTPIARRAFWAMRVPKISILFKINLFPLMRRGWGPWGDQMA